MERRHQVFVSSTFTDLVDERREVMQALLEMDCLPAGMELFPAGNDDQWTLIKGVIEQSDYYLVILGGRYGSTTEEGISYTEKEYDYALELGIPVMGFVPAEPGDIPIRKTDQDNIATEKLAEFRKKIQQKMTKEWKTSEDLGSKVTRGLMHLIKNNPRPGWVRGDQAMTPENRTEIAELKAKLADFEKQEIQNATSALTSVNTRFAHGSESVNLEITHTGLDDIFTAEKGNFKCTWDDIIHILGPSMIDEAPEKNLRRRLENHILNEAKEESYTRGRDMINITDTSWDSIIVQLRALGIITTGTKKRAINDKSIYWKLTSVGDDYLVQLRAIPSTAIR